MRLIGSREHLRSHVRIGAADWESVELAKSPPPQRVQVGVCP